MEAKLMGWEHRVLDATRLRLALEDDVEAAEWFETARWQGDVRCPRCDSASPYLIGTRGKRRSDQPGRREWRCRDCQLIFTVRRGSFMEGTKCGFATWAAALLMATERDSFAEDLALCAGVQKRTALRLEDTAVSLARQVRRGNPLLELDGPEEDQEQEPEPKGDPPPRWWKAVGVRGRLGGAMLVLVAVAIVATLGNGSYAKGAGILYERWHGPDGSYHILETRRRPAEPMEDFELRHEERARVLRELFAVEFEANPTSGE